MKLVPNGPIDNIPALVQIMAWRRPGDKPLSETMMVNLLTHMYASFGLNELIISPPWCARIGSPPAWCRQYRLETGPGLAYNVARHIVPQTHAWTETSLRWSPQWLQIPWRHLPGGYHQPLCWPITMVTNTSKYCFVSQSLTDLPRAIFKRVIELGLHWF